jgi:hypothetical protein
MLKLGQFDLEFALFGAGALRENIQNQGSSIQDLAIEHPFQIATLRRRKLIVKDNGVDIVLAAMSRKLVRFAGADECPGDGCFQFLSAVSNDVGPGRRREFVQLLQGVV